jgi:tetratricopeptide (TPR) repeat protein
MQTAENNRYNSIENLSFSSREYCIKGTLMADEGNLKEALENFNKAIEVNPNNHIAYYNRATVKIDLGDIEGGRNDFFDFDKLRK